VCIDPAGAVLTQALGFRLRRLPRPPLLPSATRDKLWLFTVTRRARLTDFCVARGSIRRSTLLLALTRLSQDSMTAGRVVGNYFPGDGRGTHGFVLQGGDIPRGFPCVDEPDRGSRH
jgi:hypothetical protein